MPYPDFTPQDPYGKAGNYAQSMLSRAMRLGVLPRQRLIGMDAKSLADLWRQKSGDVSSMAQEQGFTDPRNFLDAKQQGFKGPIGYNISPRDNPTQQGAVNFAQQRLQSVMGALPQLQGTNVGNMLLGSENQQALQNDPLAMWKQISGALAQQAQGAGFMDPRVYLASLLARRPGAMNPQNKQAQAQAQANKYKNMYQSQAGG